MITKIFQYNLKELQEFGKNTEDITKKLVDTDFNISTQFKAIQHHAGFLDHVVAFLARVTPVENSLAKTFANMPATYTIEGEKVLKEDVLALLSLFKYYPFSVFSKTAQTKSAINAATPIFLYAQRLYNNVPYNNWDRTDPLMPAILGRDLSAVLTTELPKDFALWEDARIRSVTDGKGKRHDFSAYKANKTSFAKEDEFQCVDSIESRLMKHLYLQTWIFADPKPSMVIDLEDWDLAYKTLKPINKNENDLI